MRAKKVNLRKEVKHMEGKPNIETKDSSNINGLDLAMQIYPLLDDYFCGTFAKNTKGVLMKMENGQIFQLTVTEVA